MPTFTEFFTNGSGVLSEHMLCEQHCLRKCTQSKNVKKNTEAYSILPYSYNIRDGWEVFNGTFNTDKLYNNSHNIMLSEQKLRNAITRMQSFHRNLRTLQLMNRPENILLTSRNEKAEKTFPAKIHETKTSILAANKLIRMKQLPESETPVTLQIPQNAP